MFQTETEQQIRRLDLLNISKMLIIVGLALGTVVGIDIIFNQGQGILLVYNFIAEGLRTMPHLIKNSIPPME